MIKKDEILNEARTIEKRFKALWGIINDMCNELDKEEDFEKKEIILQAIKLNIKDLNSLELLHEEKLNEL